MKTECSGLLLRKGVGLTAPMLPFGEFLRLYTGFRFGQRAGYSFAALLTILVISLAGLSASKAQTQGGMRDLDVESIAGPVRSFEILDEGSCYSFELRRQMSSDGKVTPVALGWTTSGFWRGSELHLADHTFPGLLGVFPGGSLQQHSVSLPVAAVDQEELPGLRMKAGVVTALRDRASLREPQYVYPRSSGGFIVREVSTKRVYFVSRDGFVERQYIQVGSTFEDPLGREVLLKGVKRAVPVKDGIFTLAEIKDWDDEPRTTFAYLDRISQKYYPIDVEAEFSDSSESLAALRPVFYHLDFSYLGVVGDVVYALVMERRPWVAQVDLGDSDLKTLQVKRLDLPVSLGRYEKPSKGMEDIKILAKTLGPRQAALAWMFESYRAVEMQKTPIGLVVWNDSIWILSKSAVRSDGGATWKLTELLAKGGRSFSKMVELPAEAAHVAVVPGDEYFALLEKGGVETLDLRVGRILYRPTKSALLFPVSWLSTAGSNKTKGPCKRILDDLN